MQQGICTNFGNCSKADRRELTRIPDGTDLLCPECQQPLTPKTKPGGVSTPLIAGVVLLLLLFVGAGTWFALKSTTSSPPKGTAGSSPDPATSTASTATPTPLAAPTPTPAATPTPVAAVQVALRLQGSNTIGDKLIGGLLEGFLAQEGWSNVTRVPGRDREEYSLEGVVPGSGTVGSVTVSAHGSATAFEGLGRDECDVGMASRRVKPAEQAALARLGDLTSPGCEHVLALDGLAIIVPKSNSVANLNRRQLQDLFSGRTTDWGAVGGRPGPVHLYARDDKSGTFDTFKALVLEAAPLAPGTKRFDDSNQLSDAVAADPAGIGFIGLPFVRSAKALAIAEVGAAALVPTVFTVATEDYPLSRRLYLYTAASPANPLALRFVDYALAAAGQEVVAKFGFVDQTVKKPKKEDLAVPAVPREALPPAYTALTAGADRLAVNFRFRSGSSQLDNKATDDLERVTAYLASPAAKGRQVLLLGFADNKGNERVNQTLSDERARIVAKQFASRGVLAGDSRGFGPAVPVGDNTTDDGREKNRRVEVWVK